MIWMDRLKQMKQIIGLQKRQIAAVTRAMESMLW